MSEAFIPVLPPGPFPPHGVEQDGSVDLGIRLRDALFNRETVIGPARKVLLDQARRLANSPERLVMSLDQIEALIDTWPLGAIIDDARETWIQGPDAEALAVLVRCTEVVGPVLGWPRTVDRRWPLPDEAWMRAQLDPEVAYHVLPRGPRDGSAAVLVATGLPKGPPAPVALPLLRDMHADELLGAVDGLVEGLTAGEYAAVRLDGAIGWDEATMAARERLREASEHQAAFDRYGLAGLHVGRLVEWEDLLQDAPVGTMGEVVQRTCDAIVLPTVNESGNVVEHGVFVWDGPFKPVRVQPFAVEILSLLDGKNTLTELGEMLGASEAGIRHIVGQLVELGAASA